MTLTQLEYFRILAECEQINEAAKQLFVSASTISTSIRNLETELGVELFDRPGRSIRLNEQGKLFLEYANRVLSLVDESKHAVRTAENVSKDSLIVAIPNALPVGSTIGSFLLSHPEIEAKSRNYTCIQEELNSINDVDFFVTPENLTASSLNLDSRVLIEIPMRLELRKNHPLAERNVCALEDLKDDTFVFRPDNDCFQQQINAVLSRHVFRPKRVHILDDALCVKLVNKGVAFTICMDKHKKMSRHKECLLTSIKIREFEEDSSGKFVLRAYWNRARGLSTEAEELMDMIRKKLQNYFLDEDITETAE